MKKKKMFIFLSMIIIICLFGVAASCNLCGVPIEIGDTSDTNTDTSEKDISESTRQTTSPTEDDGQQTEQTSQADQETTSDTDQEDSGEDGDGEDGDGEDGDGEDEMEDIPEPTIVTLSPVRDETGCVSADGSLVNRSEILVGHSENGNDYRGYISFDISDLSGKTIDFASLKLQNPQIFEPRAPLRDFRIGIIEYGTGLLSSSVVGIPGTPIASLPNTTSNVELSNDKLINGLQSSINGGKIRFQITLYWSSQEAYVDFANHGNLYWKENTSLLVTYF
ncbi:MAG: hypothetical protein H8E13_00070 [Actinobacteria bacterium]|nr:hypothetical protein [Actinomycetota bacterium]